MLFVPEAQTLLGQKRSSLPSFFFHFQSKPHLKRHHFRVQPKISRPDATRRFQGKLFETHTFNFPQRHAKRASTRNGAGCPGAIGEPVSASLMPRTFFDFSFLRRILEETSKRVRCRIYCE